MTPHFFSPGETVTGKKYADLLEGSVFPQINALAPSGPSVFQHDLASARTSQEAKKVIDREGIKTLPWLTAGADLNPLDIFVNDSLKNALREKSVPNVTALRRETALVISNFAKDKEWLANLTKTCRGVPKRFAWVAANGGRKVVKKLVAGFVAAGGGGRASTGSVASSDP